MHICRVGPTPTLIVRGGNDLVVPTWMSALTGIILVGLGLMGLVASWTTIKSWFRSHHSKPTRHALVWGPRRTLDEYPPSITVTASGCTVQSRHHLWSQDLATTPQVDAVVAFVGGSCDTMSLLRMEPQLRAILASPRPPYGSWLTRGSLHVGSTAMRSLGSRCKSSEKRHSPLQMPITSLDHHR